MPASRTSRELITFGALSVVFGLIASLWPLSTVVTLVVVWGVYALLDGVLSLIHVVQGRTTNRALGVVMGILGVLAGLVAIFHPISSAVALTWVLGLWLVARGVVQIVDAFGQDRPGSRWMTVLAGAAFAVAGLIVILNAGEAALGISLWMGVLAVVWGLLLLGAGLALRGRSATSSDDDSTP